jgi:hypothetical protein
VTDIDKWDPRVDSGGRKASDPKFGTEDPLPWWFFAFALFWVVLVGAGLAQLING